MIDTHEIFVMRDSSGKNNFEMEVNWSDNEELKDCKVLRVKFPNGDVSYVRKEQLNELLFAIGSRSEQEKMIPQKIRRSRWYETTLKIKAQKDIRRGEDIITKVKLALPTVEEEVIAEIKRDKSSSKLIFPSKL